MWASYRALLGRAEARSLALVCALGWWSYGGYGLAMILAVHRATASFAVAGATIAAFSVGSGLLAPARGRLIDRRGPHVLGWLATGHLAAAGMLLIGCATDSSVSLIVAAGLLGGSAPPIIATARSMWTTLGGPELAPTGHALNAALSDAAQLSSPVLTGAVALLISPSTALAMAVLGAVAAAMVLSRREGGQRALSRPSGHRVWGVLAQSSGLRTLAAGDLATGAWLAALELAVVALAARTGTPELGALPLAASALGSITMSIRVGARRSARSAGRRYVIGSMVVAGVLPLVALWPSLGSTAAVLIVAGGGFGLLNVALFELLDELVPPGRTTEAFTWLTTSQAAGSALGAEAAGRLARAGASASLALVAGLAGLAAVIAIVRRHTLTAGCDEPRPSLTRR